MQQNTLLGNYCQMAVVPKCLFYGKLTFLDAYFIGNSLKITLGEFWGRWRCCFFESWVDGVSTFLNFWVDGVSAF